MYSNEILLAILLLFSFVIRVANFNIESIYSNWDGNRLYLVANHIVKYREFPLVGASTGYIPELKKSPFWYYFTAALLLIENDILFLGWVNILFSVITILLVYFLARAMFGKGTALIAALLFSFSEFSFHQAIFFIWDAFIAQTFIILSLLMFVLSVRKRNYIFLLIGLLIFSVASAINLSSGLYIIPAILLLIFYILKKQKRQIIHYLGAFATLLATFLIFFSPVAIYQITNQNALSYISQKALIALSDFLPQLASLLYIFSDSYFLNLKSGMFSLNNFTFLAIVALLVYSLLILKNNTKKSFYFFIFVFILTPLTIITLFQVNKPFYDPQTMPIYGLLRYFLASIVLFIILISDVINSILSKPYQLPIKILLILCLIYVSFPSLSNSLNNLHNLPVKLLNNLQSQTPEVIAAKIIEQEIHRVKGEKHLNHTNFFQISTYTRGRDGDYFLDNPAFWVILEKNLNTKLVEIRNESIWTYKQIGGNEIIFLICFGYTNKEDEKTCIDSFQRENTNHSLVKQIYSQFPYSIYVTKKV